MIEDLLRYARLCQAAYEDHPRGIIHTETDSAAILDGHVLAVRGSDSRVDWRGNIKFRRAEWRVQDGSTVMAHRGFVACAEALLPLVQGLNVQVWTGHSLGGAIALLLAMRLGGSVVQFGAPKACGAKDARRNVSGTYIRVENGADAVPRRPNLFWYGHGGTLIYLHNGGGYSVDPGGLCRFADRLFDPVGRATDHRIGSYVKRLESLGSDHA